MLRVCLAISLAVTLSSAASAQSTEEFASSFVLLDKDAVGMLSPRVVCAGQAGQISWSSDGSTLMVHRIEVEPIESATVAMLNGSVTPGSVPPPPKQELVFFNVRNGRVTSTVPLGDATNRLSRVAWLPGSHVALVEILRPYQEASGSSSLREEVALVSSSGKISTITAASSGTSTQMSISPTAPLVAAIRRRVDESQETPVTIQALELYGADGQRRFSVPAPGGFSELQWSQKGSLYMVTRVIDRAAKKVTTKYFKVDTSTGQTQPVERPEPPYEGELPKLQVQNTSLPSPNGRVPAVALVGKSGKESTTAYVSTDGTAGTLAPTGDVVAYISRGIPMVRMVVHVPKEAFLAARAAAERTRMISNAKQIGLAMIMLASDLDDKLPGNGGDWQSQVSPYLRDRSMLDNFNYTFSGGDMTKVESPAETEMGYIRGAGGRAVVYIDGHVKWVKDPG